MSMKNPMIPSGIEPATFRSVAQRLTHCATAVPVLRVVLINTLITKLIPICHVLALLGAHFIFHVSGLRVIILPPQTVDVAKSNSWIKDDTVILKGHIFPISKH